MMENLEMELSTFGAKMAFSGLDKLRGREVDTSMQTSNMDSAMTGEMEDNFSISKMAAKEAPG
jgi:hypothetical protein